MGTSELLAIFGILLSVIIPLSGYWLKTRKELRNHYSVVWKKSSRLERKDVLGERPYNEYYLERSEDSILKRSLERKSNILLIGPPLIGKTRAVYEQLKAMRKKADVLIPRAVSMPTFLFPKDRIFWRNKIIFIDDLQNYVEKQNNFNLLFKNAKEKNISIIATCQSGQEFRKVRNKMIEQNIDVDILFGENIIEYEKITPETGKQIADKLNMKWDPSKFNGTIGSIFMRLSEMERRYSSCSDVEKSVLLAIRMMNITGLFSDNSIYNLDWLKLTAWKQELEGKDFEWTGWLKSLEEKEFIRIIRRNKIWAEEAYLRNIVKPGVSVNDYDVFDEMIEVFSHELQALVLIGTRAYDYGSVDINLAEYMKAVIRAFELAFKKIGDDDKPLKVKSYEYKGQAFWRLSRVDNQIQNNVEALQNYKGAIGITDKNENPYEYAKLQNMIGISLSAIAALKDTEKNCTEAIRLFKESLEYFTSNSYPFIFAQASNNLGAVYQTLGQVKEPGKNLGQAVVYLEQALQVSSPEKFPVIFADTMNNLGNTYTLLADLKDSTGNLKKALDCYSNFIKVYTKEKSLLNYSLGITNIGSIYSRLAETEDTELYCKKAFSCLNEALEIRTRDRFPMQYASVQYYIGTANITLAGFIRNAECCYRALDAFEESLTIKTREINPLHYAFSQEGLGDAYILLAEMNEDKSENYRKSLTAYNEALSVFSEDSTPELYNRMQEKITKAKKVFF